MSWLPLVQASRRPLHRGVWPERRKSKDVGERLAFGRGIPPPLFGVGLVGGESEAIASLLGGEVSFLGRARKPRRARNLALEAVATWRAGVSDQIRQIENARQQHLAQAADEEPHAMVRLLARVIGVGIEAADMLVQEVLSRNARDRRALARYSGLTGSPDESGTRRREKGLARSSNARVRGGMVQLAWRFLMFQKDSALAQWFRDRTENARGTRKLMIVALARKLLIALWRLVREGVVPDGVILRPAQ
jgi:transposase